MTKKEREELRIARWFQTVRDSWDEVGRRFTPQPPPLCRVCHERPAFADTGVCRWESCEREG
jgi:hypothetical protein